MSVDDYKNKQPTRPSELAFTCNNSREIEQCEQTDGVPGTTDLIDVEQKRTGIKHAGNGIVLIPQPSSDPSDPLNWSKFRKFFFISQASFSTFMICVLTAIFGVTVEGFASVGVSTETVNQGTATSLLFLGWLNILFQPLSMSYGRRFFMLMMTFGCGVGATVWNAYTFTNASFFGARILQGILGAPVECLIEVLVADVFFEHERGRCMSIYGFALYGGSFLGPLASAWIVKNMSWQWVFYFIAIFSGAIGVLMLFCFEESGYKRSFPILDGTPVMPKVQDDSKNNPKIANSKPEPLTSVMAMESHPTCSSSRSYRRRMQLFTSLGPFPSKWQFLRPILVLYKLPHIQWAGWMVATSVAGFQIVSGTIDSIFSAEPYNFSEGSIGLCYISGVIGIIIGCIFSGPFNDWLCLRIARARGGIHEAEDRIYITLSHIILFPASFILYGVGAAHGIHWSGPIIGLGIMGFCLVNSAIVPYTYVMEAAGGIGSECIVAVILMRNTISFALIFGITPWVDGMGVQNAFISVAFILGFAFWITAVPVLIWGKRSRTRSAHTYYKWVATKDLE